MGSRAIPAALVPARPRNVLAHAAIDATASGRSSEPEGKSETTRPFSATWKCWSGGWRGRRSRCVRRSRATVVAVPRWLCACSLMNERAQASSEASTPGSPAGRAAGRGGPSWLISRELFSARAAAAALQRLMPGVLDAAEHLAVADHDRGHVERGLVLGFGLDLELLAARLPPPEGRR